MRILLAAAVMAAVHAPASAATPESMIVQSENDWTVAVVKKDYAAIERIVAKDWSGQSGAPDRYTRAKLIADLKSGDQVYKSQKNTPMTVKVIGDVAIVQGGDDEVSSFKGKDTSGKYTWTDIYAKRDGKWQAVFSQVSKVTP